MGAEKRRRQRLENAESRRRNVESLPSSRADRNLESGGLLVRRETSRTELFQSTAESTNVMEEDRYDQLFMQASRRIGDDSHRATVVSPSATRSNYSRNMASRNFFDDV